MASTTDESDAAYVDNKDIVRLILPDYRKAYAAYDFTDSESRSLDNAIAEYLSKSAMRRFWNPPKKLVLEVKTDSRDSHREEVTEDAYRKMFTWRARAAVHRFFRQLPLAVTLVALGITILWASHQVKDANMEEDIRNTLSSVVQVGAWVALWSAISLLFEVGYSTLGDVVSFRRLARMPIEFHYEADGKEKQRKMLKMA